LLAACAAPGTGAPRSHDPPQAIQLRASTERRYAIWLGGAQVGTAAETEQWSATGVIVRRTEAMQYLRGDAAVALAMTIEIVADAALVPSRVTWTEQAQATRHGEAVRDAAGWTVTDDAGVRRLPARAIPAELAPLIVRRDGHFAGPVFLPARGFVAGAGRIEPVAPGRLVARLVFAAEATAGATAGATAEATIDLADDGMPLRVVDGEGVIATRITAAEARQPFTPVDLIAATAIALTGTPSHRLRLDGELAVPPVPGQRTQLVPDGAVVELSADLAGGLPPGVRGADRTREIAALVRRVRGRIAPDLAADPTSARTAAAATAGDCTTFALAYTALAGERAIPTLVVTGFRIDGDRLVRHRWAVSWTGRAWIAVDAAFGAVPAGGDLVGLALHDADDLGLVAGEAALTHVRAATWK
jgi:Transglutaminase-like superfamily